MPFLDILIKRNENGIWMHLSYKPTDTQRCLPFTSSQSNHCKRNIPFCLAQRICTIAENNAEKLKNLENLKTTLSKYHYPDSLIKQGFEKVFTATSLLKCCLKTTEKMLGFSDVIQAVSKNRFEKFNNT